MAQQKFENPEEEGSISMARSALQDGVSHRSGHFSATPRQVRTIENGIAAKQDEPRRRTRASSKIPALPIGALYITSHLLPRRVSISARSGAAQRMRLFRERRRKGLRCVMVELRETEVDALIRQGLLNAEMRDDPIAVVKGLYAYLDRTLGSMP